MAGTDFSSKYSELVDKYELLRQRVNKAKEQKDRFKNAVVMRVISDYENQLRELEQQLAPCEEEIQKNLAILDSERLELESNVLSCEEQKDEIELRNILGEFTEKDYKDRINKIEVDYSKYSKRLKVLNEQIRIQSDLLSKSSTKDRKISSPQAFPQKNQQAPAVTNSRFHSSNVSIPPSDIARISVEIPIPAISQASYSPAPSKSNGVQQDILSNSSKDRDNLWGERSSSRVADSFLSSTVFDDDAFDKVLSDDDADAFDVIVDDINIPKNTTASDKSNNKSYLSEQEPEWQQGLLEDFTSPGVFRDLLDPSAAGPVNPREFPNLVISDNLDEVVKSESASSSVSLVASLVRRTGKPEEDVAYEIKDDMITIGRGRDNQIQIKDDTKVSRYHCRVIKEPSGYYVEDNNSSNGTLVNGELITRRKVEGGEDVTIGETVFRFQLS